MTIKKYTKEDFKLLKLAGKITSNSLNYIEKIIKPGISTNLIDEEINNFLKKNNAYSAPLFYRGYPKSVCTSINHVVCHGIPSEKILNEGDIVNVDVTAVLNGYHGDASKTFCVGDVSIKAKKLVQTTYESMMEGINIIKPGIKLGDLGFAIQSYAEAQRFFCC